MKNRKLFWLVVLATLISTVFAFIFFGTAPFSSKNPPIYLVFLSFAGAFALGLLLQKRTRDAIYIYLFIFFLFAILTSIFNPPTISILFIYFMMLFLALYTYVKSFNKKIARIPWVRALVIGAIVAIFYFVGTLIHGLIYYSHFSKMFLLVNMPLGFLVGLSLGLAVELQDRFKLK